MRHMDAVNPSVQHLALGCLLLVHMLYSLQPAGAANQEQTLKIPPNRKQLSHNSR